MTLAHHCGALLGAAGLALAASPANSGPNYPRSDIRFSGYLVSPCAGVASGSGSTSAGDLYFMDNSFAPSVCNGVLGSLVSGSASNSAGAQWQQANPYGATTQTTAATAAAGFGWSKLSASAQAGPSNIRQVTATALGGFADVLTVLPVNQEADLRRDSPAGQSQLAAIPGKQGPCLGVSNVPAPIRDDVQFLMATARLAVWG